jgi:hypothetical protein
MSEDLYVSEGEVVDVFLVKLPAISLESDVPLARDSWMTVELDVSVKSVTVAENRSGQLVREHVLKVDGAKIKAKGTYVKDLDAIAPVPPHIEP